MGSNKYFKKVKQVLRFVPDAAYLRLYYLAKFRRPCDLRNPRTFNEKLQWLKLYYRVPDHSKLVDKHDVKPIVAEMIGVKHIIPTLAVYDRADQIDFDELPNAFVLKCTHDSEGIAIVRNKNEANIQEIRENLTRALGQNFYYIGREPHYRELRPRIIAEAFVEDQEQGQLLDYKFFCFGGEVKAMFIASDRSAGETKFDYFDADFESLDVRQSYPQSAVKPKKPERYEEMLSIARVLSHGHPHVRVDLYEVNGEIYFGELTFFHFSGFAPFVPETWDRVFGDWLTLPTPVGAAQRRRRVRFV